MYHQRRRSVCCSLVQARFIGCRRESTYVGVIRHRLPFQNFASMRHGVHDSSPYEAVRVFQDAAFKIRGRTRRAKVG